MLTLPISSLTPDEQEIERWQSPRVYKHHSLDRGPIDPKRICTLEFINQFLTERRIPYIPITALRFLSNIANANTATIDLCYLDYNGITKKVVVKKFHPYADHPDPERRAAMSTVHFLNEAEKLSYFSDFTQRRRTRLYLSTLTTEETPTYDTHILTTGKVSQEEQKNPIPIIQCDGYYFEDAEEPWDRKMWLIIEYAEKGCLENHLLTMNFLERVQASLALFRALDAMLATNLVHADIKSLNFFWCLEGEFNIFKLGDFGAVEGASEQWYLFKEDMLKDLLEKKFSFLDYTPAIVLMPADDPWLILKSTKPIQLPQTQKQLRVPKILTQCWPITKEPETFYAVSCPDFLKKYIVAFFNRHPIPPSKDISQLLPFYVPQEHKLMQHLRSIGYHQSFLADWLEHNGHVGSYLWMAPELPEGGLPRITTDIFSAAIFLSEIWRGKTPYSEPEYNRMPACRIFYKVTDPEQKLRPSLENMYSYNGFVDIQTLVPYHQTLAIKEWIEACWDLDPNKRPTIERSIYCFQGLLDEIIVKAVTRNQAPIVEYLLDRMPDLSWCFKIREFQDEPATLCGRINLLQWAVWSCNPIALILLNNKRIKHLKTQWEGQLQPEDANLSIWRKKNGQDAIEIIKNLLILYQSYEILTTDAQKKETLSEMGELQRKIPSRMAGLYFQFQNIKNSNPDTPQHVQGGKLDFSYLNEDDENIKRWYKKPQAIISDEEVLGLSEFLPMFELGAFCYSDQQKKLCRSTVLPLLETESSIDTVSPTTDAAINHLDFECAREQAVFKEILDESTTVSIEIKRFTKHMIW